MSTDSKPRRGRTNLASGKPKVQPIADPADLAMERGLPANLDAKRFVLGSILLNDARFAEVDLNPDRKTQGAADRRPGRFGYGERLTRQPRRKKIRPWLHPPERRQVR